MKKQRLEILQKVANGELTPEKADTELLGLSIVRTLPSSKEAYNEGLKRRRRGEKKQHWKAKIFAAGANWMKSVATGCSDVVGN